MTIDWDDPAARARLIETVGPEQYAKLQQQHFDASIVATVAGHSIRPVMTRFGRLYQVGLSGTAFRSLAEAEAYARENSVASK